MIYKEQRTVFYVLLIGLGFAILGLLPSAARAETIEIFLSYPLSDLDVGYREGLADVRLPGCDLVPVPGAPALPRLSEQVVLPEGMLARSVRAVSVSSVRLPCGDIRPVQPPAILGPVGIEIDPPAPVAADPAIYAGSTPYPPDLVTFRGCGYMGDAPIASCEVCPVQFDPSTGELVLHTRIALTLEIAEDAEWSPRSARPREMSRLVGEFAAARMHSAENLASPWEQGRGMRLDPDDYQYVIVTVEEQLEPYETYAAWKTAKGVPATVVTVEWIDANYGGRDAAEKTRNFIRDAVAEWGTTYVLLGGDQHIVPARVCWAFDCEAGFYSDENDLYADLYFADLDGSWDENENDIFGEVEDNIDLYPDVVIGRAPTDDLAQANATVNKFLTYERTPPSGRAMEAFFFAEVLWSNPYTDSGVGKDMIAERHFGDAYDPIERQYESLGNESPASVLSYLNWGPHLTNHAGHANYSVMGCGDGYIDREDVDNLSNAPYFFVLYSIGCWAGAVDYGCIGEHFLVDDDGGTVAFVGNCRYGWGSPGNPGMGYSETFDSDFYGALLTEGLTQFGAAVAWPKILRIPYSRDGNVYRWHEYQVNLFGDPEMVCHTAEITDLALDAPEAIPVGASQFTATVTDVNGAVANARFCLAGSDVYAVGFSDAMGQVVFNIDVPAAQTLTLTTTAANHPYAERTIVAAGNDPFLTVVAKVIDDDASPPSAGNSDGEIGPGEVLEFFVTVHNYGGSDASGVTGTLSETSPYVEITAATGTYGTVTAGGEATNATPFVFQVAHGCPPEEVLPFELHLEDGLAGSWTLPINLRAVAPGPRFHHYNATEVVGNGDGIVDPGETIELTVYVRNEGSGNLGPMDVTLSTTDPDLAVVLGAASTFASLDPGAIAVLDPPFEVQVDPGCAATTYGDLDLAFSHDEGYAEDSFLLAIGEPGFNDDMESGVGGWIHSGSQDQWHLTDYRSHSENHSWYCGSPETHTYANNADASLTSADFVVPEDAVLSFWCYFDVTIYGTDGLFVETWQDGDWETIDYLGSGGALVDGEAGAGNGDGAVNGLDAVGNGAAPDSTLFVVGWAEYRYSLSELEPGSTTKVRFRLVTDGSDADEGFYLDDVVIRCPETSRIEIPIESQAFQLIQTSPSPTQFGARWRLILPSRRHIRARIYDPMGRLVTTLLDRPMEAGSHGLEWDGCDRRGAHTPDGIYFLRLMAGSERCTRRVLRIGR